MWGLHIHIQRSDIIFPQFALASRVQKMAAKMVIEKQTFQQCSTTGTKIHFQQK
jgi:hypothetical protein